jgi:hypothetical protein
MKVIKFFLIEICHVCFASPHHFHQILRHNSPAETDCALSVNHCDSSRSLSRRTQKHQMPARAWKRVHAGHCDVGHGRTGYPLHSPVSPSLPRPCVILCHQISAELQPSTTLWQPRLHDLRSSDCAWDNDFNENWVVCHKDWTCFIKHILPLNKDKWKILSPPHLRKMYFVSWREEMRGSCHISGIQV